MANPNKKNEFTVDEYAAKASSGGENYYEQARQQEYDVLLDTEVALENAKANALKHTQTQMEALGLGSSGYGGTVNSGIYNDYLNRVGAAKIGAQQNIGNINLAEAEADKAAANDRFESITTMFQAANSADEMNQLLVDYGYGTVGEDGEFVWGEKPENMSDDDWNQMKYYYTVKKNNINSGNFDEGYTGAYYTSLEQIKNATIPIEGGRTDTIKNKFDKETDILFAHISSGDLPYGAIVKMTNGNGEVTYMKFTQNGVRIATQADYESGSNEIYEIVRNEKDKYSWIKR